MHCHIAPYLVLRNSRSSPSQTSTNKMKPTLPALSLVAWIASVNALADGSHLFNEMFVSKLRVIVTEAGSRLSRKSFTLIMPDMFWRRREVSFLLSVNSSSQPLTVAPPLVLAPKRSLPSRVSSDRRGQRQKLTRTPVSTNPAISSVIRGIRYAHFVMTIDFFIDADKVAYNVPTFTVDGDAIVASFVNVYVDFLSADGSSTDNANRLLYVDEEKAVWHAA
ncbi:uncharacterized protein L969DRAFT_50089 [Mixia osmundae IAM 14324]|uniref:Uncharacterized protein n=1 Tax=Mixia osmundae (strain CBS 9802 / IAM 14324 / JCM 22182 / KY 12970) TaxID=764103 RepID=G7E6V8_MIXOS|nr:uncharacterized protein L969DRAFT_50089 [Mixia osmundae IAM 14324]KEI39050.1 hypothetical protein L969DRAFT_50089 [Mixia osmundae IAM 14324]GAA98568.1 hypothetical protein E5Q_05255 [Mixia osmundae IAM 14324]